MQKIARRVEEMGKIAKFTQTTALMPGKPNSSGDYQIIIISSTPLIAPDGATSIKTDSVVAWMIVTMGAAAVYTEDSPKPIKSIAFADTSTLQKRAYYVLDMALARELQQKLKGGAIDPAAAYKRISGALVKTVIPDNAE